MADINERLYTKKEVAEMLKITTMTVYNYIKSGKLKAVRVGDTKNGKVLITESSIKSIVNNIN